MQMIIMKFYLTYFFKIIHAVQLILKKDDVLVIYNALKIHYILVLKPDILLNY